MKLIYTKQNMKPPNRYTLKPIESIKPEAFKVFWNKKCFPENIHCVDSRMWYISIQTHYTDGWKDILKMKSSQNVEWWITMR